MGNHVLAAGFWVYLVGMAAFGSVFVVRLVEVLTS
jgi:hypothetical protein